METIKVKVLGQEIDLIQLEYKDIENIILPSYLGGITDPIGQALDFIYKSLKGVIDTAISGLSSLVNTVRDAIINSINTVASTITSAINNIATTITGAISGFVSTISSMISGAITTIGNTISSFASTIGSIISNIGATISSIGSSIMSSISGFVSTISNTISSIAGSIMRALEGVGRTIMDGVRGFIDGIAKTLSSLASTISAGFGSVINSISRFIGDVVNAIKGIATTLGSVASSIINTITSAIGSIVNSIKTLAGEISKSISGIIDTIVKTIQGIIDTISKTFQEIGGKIIESFSGAFSTLQTFIGNVFENISKSLLEIGKTFEGFVNAISKIGDFLAPVFKPITDFFESIKKGIIDFVNKFVDFLTKDLPKLGGAILDFLTKTVPKFFLEDVPKFFTQDLPKAIWDLLPDWLKDILTNIGKFFTETVPKFFLEDIPNFFKKAYDFITKDVPDFFTKTLPKWILEDIPKFFTQDLPKAIWDLLPDWLKKAFEEIYKFFTETVPKFFLEDIPNFFKEAYKFITEKIPKFFTETLPKFFTEDLPKYILDGLKFIMEKLQGLGEAILNFFKFLGNLFNQAILGIVEITRGAFESFFNNMIMPVVKPFLPGSPSKEVEKAIKELYNAVIENINKTIKEIKKHKQITVEIVNSILTGGATILIASSGAEITGAVADASHPAKTWQVRKIIKSIISTLGVQFIPSAFLTATVYYSYMPILRRWFYKQTTPNLPATNELVEMYYRKWLTERDYYVYMSEQGLNKEFAYGLILNRQKLLGLDELHKLVGFEYIEKKKAYREMEKIGYDPELIAYIYDITRPLPSIEDLIKFWRLGKLSDKELQRHIGFRDYADTYKEAYYSTRLAFPGVSDMITAVVKEAMSPIAFKELLKRQGLVDLETYQKELNLPAIAEKGLATVEETLSGTKGVITWADVFYEAHWKLPDMTRIIEFFNRALVGLVSVGGKAFKVSDEIARASVLLYSRLWDYKPVPRTHTVLVDGKAQTINIPVSDAQIVEALRFRTLTRIESRFVRRWGLISTEDYMRLAIAEGIDPYITIKTADGKDTTMLKALVKAEFLQDLVEERTALRTAILNSFKEGFNIKFKAYDVIQENITEIETLKLDVALKSIGFRNEEISWLMAKAYIDRQVDIRKDYLKSLIDDFSVYAISVDDFQKELAKLVDDEELRKVILELSIKRRIRDRLKRSRERQIRQLYSELDTKLKLYEDGFSNVEAIKNYLNDLIKKEIITEDEANILLDVSTTRRKRNLIELALRSLGKKLSRGAIDIGTFIAKAQELGVEKEFIDAYLENYSQFYTLSVSGLISYADDIPLPDEFIDKKLKQLNVPEDEAKIIKAVIKRRPIIDEIRSLATTLLTEVGDLTLSPDDYKDVLKQLGFTDEEIKLRYSIAVIRGQKAIRKQLKKTLDVLLREQYQGLAKGKDLKLITLQEYIDAYRKLGVPDNYIIARAQEIIASASQTKLKEFDLTKLVAS
jgi:hypothetical protein